MKYEVQTKTFFDGWINVWSWEDGEGEPKRQLFDSREDAEHAIEEFISDTQAQGMDYDADDYRVVEVTDA